MAACELASFPSLAVEMEAKEEDYPREEDKDDEDEAVYGDARQ